MEAIIRKERVAIVGAGVSGLTACKHLLGKGFRPVVFDAAASIGGVWARTLASTRLQTSASWYQFSDFPWPADSGEVQGPRHDQVLDYLTAYARRFGVLERVRLRSKVLGATYAGAPEQEVAAWERWSGNGSAFGDGTGEWHLTVLHDDGEQQHTQTYEFDFLILCVGRYGAKKVPAFPHGRDPEVFHGRVLHSMDYSSMAHLAAAELVRGKRVAVVGAGKSALDVAAQCAEANGSTYPCTMVYRSAHWMVDPKVARRVNFVSIYPTRLTELMVHKPGEGLVLSLIATMLSPLRWLMIKIAEMYCKAKIPMRKHDLEPEYSLPRLMLGWRLDLLPARLYDMVDDGSLQLRRCRRSVGFCADGLVLDEGTGDDERVVDADVIILATGFDTDRPLKDVFASSSPRFSEMVVTAAEPSDDAVAPLYRLCLHPRIPQMAVVGSTETATNIYTFEMMAKWVAHLLAGAVRLPGVRDMERDVADWARWGRWAKRRSGPFFLKSCIAAVTTWYHDQLCRDMGYPARRKDGLLADWLQPYGPTDYAAIQ